MELIGQLEDIYTQTNGQLATPQHADQILDILKQLTQLMKANNQEDSHRSKLTPSTLKLVQSIINDSSRSNVDLLEECLRFLRNAVAFNATNQNMVHETTNLLQWTANFLDNQINATQPHQMTDLSIKLCFQFLINCIVDNERNASLVSSLSPNFLPQYISRGVNEAGYLLNTILRLLPDFSSQFFQDVSMFKTILDNTDIDSNIILLETLASNSEFLNTVYNQLGQSQHLAYLEFLKHCQSDIISIPFFSSQFQTKADAILKSNLEQLEIEFQEIALLLELISSSSQIEVLSEDRPLVTTAIHLLQLTSKSDLFQPVEKLSQVTEEHQDHPGFLFKANLIRLLGNVAHDHFENQTLVGKSCLEIILNCTRIDALNPFITQWSILAIRNLLHNHHQNQAMVSNLRLQSATFSPVLEEFGIKVEVTPDENKVTIKSNKT